MAERGGCDVDENCAASQSPSPAKESDPGVEVRLLIQTTSGNAQHQLDRLQRSASNNDLQNLIETQGSLSISPLHPLPC